MMKNGLRNTFSFPPFSLLSHCLWWHSFCAFPDKQLRPAVFAAGPFFCKDCEKKDSCPWERRKFAGKKNGFCSTIEKFFFKKTVSLCIKIPKIIVKFSAGRRGEKLVSFYGFVYTMKWDGIWLSHFGNIQNTRYRCRSRKTGLFAVGHRVCICFFRKKTACWFFCFTKKQQLYSDYLYYHQIYETGGLLWKI